MQPKPAKPEGMQDVAHIVLLRGVGLAGADASLKAAGPIIRRFLSEDAIVVEANWSQQVAGDPQSSWREGLFVPTLDPEFVVKLSRAWRGCAMDADCPRSTSNAFGLLLLRVSGLGLSMLPVMCAMALLSLPRVLVALVVAYVLTIVAAAIGAKLIGPTTCAASRHFVLATFWPLALFVLAIALAPIKLFVGLGAAVAVLGLLSRSLDPSLMFHDFRESGGIVAPSPFMYIGFVLAIIAATTAAAVIGRIALRLLAMPFAPFAKICADIVRYRGDPEYQDAVMRSVLSAIELGTSRRSLVLVGHSLGSVIAIDLLRARPDVLREFGRIVLITGGSPLRRFFARFFPHAYGAPLSLLRELASAYPSFRWINVYRPFDPIGAALGLPATQERSTNQRLWGLRAHSDYWSDPKVVRQIRLAQKQPLEHQAATATPNSGPILGRIDERDWIGSLTYLSVACTLLLVATILAWGVSIGPILQGRSQHELLRTQRTETTTGFLHRWRESGGGSFLSFARVTEHWQVEFEAADVPHRFRATRANLDLDLARNQTEWEAAALDSGMATTAIEVQIEYLTSDPTVFCVAGLRPKPLGVAWLAFGFGALLPWLGLALCGAYFVWTRYASLAARIYAGFTPQWSLGSKLESVVPRAAVAFGVVLVPVTVAQWVSAVY